MKCKYCGNEVHCKKDVELGCHAGCAILSWFSDSPKKFVSNDLRLYEKSGTLYVAD